VVRGKRTVDALIEFFELREFVEWGKMPQKACFCSIFVPGWNMGNAKMTVQKLLKILMLKAVIAP
jgi:hypothetical protein